MNKQNLKYIILAVSIIIILGSSWMVYRTIYPKPQYSATVTEAALERIEKRIADLESTYKEAKKDARVSAEQVEREVSALAPDDVAVQLSALLEQSRGERRDRVRTEGVDQPD